MRHMCSDPCRKTKSKVVIFYLSLMNAQNKSLYDMQFTFVWNRLSQKTTIQINTFMKKKHLYAVNEGRIVALSLWSLVTSQYPILSHI